MKLQIVSDGTPYNTQVKEVETGLNLTREILSIRWSLSHHESKAEIETLWTALSVVVDAEIDPLSYAVSIIHAYENEIRQAIKDGKVPEGFCQGSVFQEAVSRLYAMKRSHESR